MFHFRKITTIGVFFLCQLANAQTRVVMDANVFLTLADTGHLVVDNPSTNGITVVSTANIISEGENNAVKWVISNNTGNYVVPFTTNSLVKIPLEVNITTAGASTNGDIIFSTYETTTDKNLPYPSDVTNLNSNCKDSVGLNTVDRFWRIEAENYSTKPTLIINFGFDNSANEVALTNTISANALKAMRFNSAINSWETPQKLHGTASASTVTNATVLPTDFYKSWTLVDSSIMAISIGIASAPSLSVCNGEVAVISATGATSYTLLPNNITSNGSFSFAPITTTTYSVIGSVGTGSTVCLSIPSPFTTVSITVNQTPTVSILSVSPSKTVCAGQSATITSNGASTYTLINTNATVSPFVVTPTITTVYNIVGTSTNGCVSNNVSSLTLTIEIGSGILVSTTTASISCFGGNNGAITASVTSASAYGYLWSNGMTTGGISNLTAGVYSLTVTDANNCKTIHTTAVPEPNDFVITAQSNTPSCDNAPTGVITLNIIGGTPTYSVLWSNATVGLTATNLHVGVVTATITDNNACVANYSATVSEEKCIITTIPNFLSPNGDGKNEPFLINTITYFPNNKLEIYNRWGSLVYSKEKYDNSFNGQPNVSNATGNGLLPAGTYFVVFDFGDGKTPPYKGYVEVKY